MDLSTTFSIDVDAPWVQAHNAQAAEVLAAHEQDRPIRVPVLCGDAPHQHGFYADEIGLDYRDYYSNLDEMVRVQLEAARRRRELPIYDFALGQVPESWPVLLDFHPVTGPGWFGCELLYRKDTVIAHRGLNLSKDECRALTMPDPRTGGILKMVRAFWTSLKERYEGKLEFLGRPVGPFSNGVGANGFFSLTLDLRGADIMVDMVEDPDFAKDFLMKVATWSEALAQAWAAPGEDKPGPFGFSDHGIEMLSVPMYEQFIVPIIQELNRQRGTEAWTSLHHCGRGTHLFPVMQRHFGLTHMDALTFPLVDIARVRREIGEDVWILAHVADEIVQLGPPERIRQTVKDLMTSGAKGKGRLALDAGDMLKGTPLEHRLAFYESVKEFGKY